MDGTALDDLKNKLSSMFIASIQPDITVERESEEHRNTFHKKSSGLLGGTEQLNNIIKEGKQENILIQSAPKPQDRKRSRPEDIPPGPSHTKQRRRKLDREYKIPMESKKRYPSRSPLPPPTGYRNRDSYSPPEKRSTRGKYRYQEKPAASGSGQQREEHKSKSEFTSPKSFLDAWTNGFFTSAAIMLVTAVGLVTDKLLFLHSLPIGGRLMSCVLAWKILTENRWVRNVIHKGYQTPLLCKPRQTRILKNPEVSNPDAYQVLLTEAQGLLDKSAIKEVLPSPD